MEDKDIELVILHGLLAGGVSPARALKTAKELVDKFTQTPPSSEQED